MAVLTRLQTIFHRNAVEVLDASARLAATLAAFMGLSSSAAFAATGTEKSYAVFVAAYDSSTGRARGGVAGTAFFISPDKAITAFHVLQAESFRARSTRERVQIWLVHEGEPAIELLPSEITEFRERDLSTIQLPTGKHAPTRHVFELAKATVSPGRIRTEGFLANSIGPLLQIAGDHLEIKAVPLLNRLDGQGDLEGESRVNLESNDVNLNEIPCLHLTYRPIVGLSGGPVLGNDGKVIGMNSFADPRDRASTWAIALSALPFSN